MEQLTGTAAFEGFDVHRLSWVDFDALAQGEGEARVVRRLRHAERSRRLLLLRALVDEVGKFPELSGPLPSAEAAWELLVRVQEKVPDVLDLILAHPYTGSWAGYTTRLLRSQITGVCPVWLHVGHVHALAAAAAIRAGLDFEATVPVWDGGSMLPTLGLVRLTGHLPHSVAEVRSEQGVIRVGNVVLPANLGIDGPGWWAVRRVTMRASGQPLTVRLDDLDPYRGPYEPLLPQRLDASEVTIWRSLLDDAWQLIAGCLPDVARALYAGFDSLVPRPAVPFRLPSASSGEAFGSAIIARPSDAAALAATLVHEFQHIRLSGLLHLTKLANEDPSERFYVGWRDDPRPLDGVVQGLYAFFGVTAFWRSLVGAGAALRVRALFEFAYWRSVTWRVLCLVRNDPELTPSGRRFLAGIAERLGPWQDEPVRADLAARAASVAADHYTGWRIRHVRPSPVVVARLVGTWPRRHNGSIREEWSDEPKLAPDGAWRNSRADLVRLRIAGYDLDEIWSTVPEATMADFDYASERFADAAHGYLAELETDADSPAAWAGLGLALSRSGDGVAGRALLHRPELVRAVHRELRGGVVTAPPADVAAWLGRMGY